MIKEMTKEEAIKVLMYDVSLIISHTIDGTHEKIDQAIKCNEALVLGVEALKNQKIERWIPCNEKLPKEFESVLVCYRSQSGIAQAVSERLTNMDGSNRWSTLAGIEPIAWMPLPEPYKE